MLVGGVQVTHAQRQTCSHIFVVCLLWGLYCVLFLREKQVYSHRSMGYGYHMSLKCLIVFGELCGQAVTSALRHPGVYLDERP